MAPYHGECDKRISKRVDIFDVGEDVAVKIDGQFFIGVIRKLEIESKRTDNSFVKEDTYYVQFHDKLGWLPYKANELYTVKVDIHDDG